MRTLTPILLGLAALLPVIGCTGEGDGWPERAGPKVVVSFAPLASIAQNIAGEDAVVKSLLSSQGPHSGDTKFGEAKLMRRADLFFLNGLGLDERLAGKLGKLSGPQLRTVNLGARIDPRDLLEGGACDHDEPGHDHAHDHGDNTDPHVWLGIKSAKLFAASMRDELKKADPAHAAGYDARAASYLVKLDQLQADGTALLKGKVERKFLPFHGSMGYFAATFGLTMVEPIQTTPGKEPTPKKLEEIIKSCQANKVRVIAVEPQFSGQSSAKRILEELHRRGVPDAVLVELDPLETCDPADLTADWYAAKMRANVEALAKVLK